MRSSPPNDTLRNDSPARDMTPDEQALALAEAAASPEGTTAPEAQQQAAPGLWALLAIFRHRNYRLFFSGQLISLMGNWITTVALGWLVYSMTQSPLMLGLTTFASQVPVFFLGAIGGTIADRFDRRTLLVITQSCFMVESVLLAVLTFTGVIEVWHIMGIALFKGFINAVDVPSRQAFTIDMVGREDLRTAIALNSILFNLARVIGPTIGGLLVALVGEGMCFAIDAVSYGAVLIGLLMMHFRPLPPRILGHPLQELKDGISYAWGNPQIRTCLLLISACSAFGASYLPMMPAVVRDILRADAEELGLMLSSAGAGALIGGVALALVRDKHLFHAPMIFGCAFGVSLMLFANTHWLPLSMALALPTAFFLTLLGGTSNTIVQLISSDHMRGRVVALYVMAFMGMMPWGSLFLGWLASRIGVSGALSVGGAVCTMASCAAYYWGPVRKRA